MDLSSTSLSWSRVVLRSFGAEDAREVFAAATLTQNSRPSGELSLVVRL